MSKGMLGALAALVLAVSAAAASATTTGAAEERGRYIVVLEDGVEHPGLVARGQTEELDGRLGFVYRYALNGYSAELSQEAVERLRRDPRVKYLAVDGPVELVAQTTPTGVKRVFAPPNKLLDIDESDDLRIDVDVAVIDTGVNAHADLDLEEQTDCFNAEAKCVEGSGADTDGHGTSVAGIVGAVDNGIGTLGTAPGARIWSVKISDGKNGTAAQALAGMNWVAATRKDGDPDNDIEVANMSFTCANQCPLPNPYDEAVVGMAAAGVVPVAAAGNGNVDVVKTAPANSPDAITVSGIADYDGKAGGESLPTCEQSTATDDTKLKKSNFGAGIDVAAPAACIYTTAPGGGYGLASETSAAAPHVAGAAAVLAAQEQPQSKADVEAIEEAIEKAGNSGWTDTSGDGFPEPLLDMSSEQIFWGWSPTATFFTNVGSLGSGNGQFNAPADVEVDPATGDLLVADKGNHRIQRLNSKGEYLSQFGSEGGGNGQLKSPLSVAVDSKGDIWVADSGNNRLQKFQANGEFIKTCGSKGTGPGQFGEKGPKAIAVGAEDSVWVTDYSGRALKFNYNCSYVTSITGFGETAGVDIASGKIWISDLSADTVKVYNEAGSLQFKIDATGSGLGQLNGPDGVEVDSKGNVWVLETENDRVQQFNQAGKYRSQFGSGFFTVSSPVSLTSDGKGGIWFSHNTGNRLQKWVVPSYGPAYAAAFGSNGSGNGQFKAPADVEVDAATGNLLVADQTNHRIQRFNSKGEYLSQFGSEGSGNGQLKSPRGVAVDSKGNIWVADSGNFRIQKFNSKGEYLTKCGSAGIGNGQFSVFRGPKAIAVDAADNVWVTDYSQRAQKFNSSCVYQASITGFTETAGIDVGAEKIWIADWFADKVKVYSEAAAFQFEFGTAGSGLGRLNGPDGVEVEGKKRVWVLETENDRVQGFGLKGEYLSQFGAAGAGAGQFSLSWPAGLTGNGKGSLWIADNGNNRVQRWTVPKG